MKIDRIKYRSTGILLLILAFTSLPEIQAQEVELLFAGDAMQHKSQLDNAYRGEYYDYSSCFHHIRHDIERADLAIVNLEVTLGGKPYKGYPMFSAPDEFAAELKNIGFDLFLTANNHAVDRFSRGINRTIDVLDSIGARHTGTFKNEEERNRSYPLMIDCNGLRLAFLNYTYGTNGLTPTPPSIVNYIDEEQISKDILKAKSEKADVIIANMHWGQEYKLLPDNFQRNSARFLLEQGVHIVMGSHPHVVQPSEIITDEEGEPSRLVVYSLGNFISGMVAENTDGGQLISLKLRKEGDRIRITSCGYILHYTLRMKSGSRTDFMVVPVSLAEGVPGPLSRAATIHPDPLSQSRMNRFAENARKLFRTNNRGVPEFRSRPPQSKKEEELLKFLPVKFAK